MIYLLIFSYLRGVFIVMSVEIIRQNSDPREKKMFVTKDVNGSMIFLKPWLTSPLKSFLPRNFHLSEKKSMYVDILGKNIDQS